MDIGFIMWQKQVQAYIAIYLKSKGYPWTPLSKSQANTKIMQLLPDIFRGLDRADLIPPNFTYELFYKAALKQYKRAKQ
jgi:hypothetical protein